MKRLLFWCRWSGRVLIWPNPLQYLARSLREGAGRVETSRVHDHRRGGPDLIDTCENLGDPPVNRVVGGASVYGKHSVTTEHGLGKDDAELHLYAFFLEEGSSPLNESGVLVLSSHVQVYSFPC